MIQAHSLVHFSGVDMQRLLTSAQIGQYLVLPKMLTYRFVQAHVLGYRL